MKKLYRYYLNGNEAYRLGLAIKKGIGMRRDGAGMPSNSQLEGKEKEVE